MAYLLYSVLYACALVLCVPYFLYRSLRDPAFGRSLIERIGVSGAVPSGRRSIWIHAVSVGEAVAAGTLVPRLREAYPGLRIAVSVTTPTGRRIAEEKLAGADVVFYCPFDLAFLVRRRMRQLRPAALIVIETEIWPHLLREAHRAGAATLLVNGRISDRSFPRYLRIRYFLKRYLAEIDRFLMQNELYAERVASLGADPESIRIVGSLKFDGDDGKPTVDAARVAPAERPIWIAGSTLEPEERILLSVFGRIRDSVPDLCLVLAPRHPARFDEVVELTRARGLRVTRRSENSSRPAEADVLVLDTLGELASVYREADLVFVGGSLAPWGGHNIIEPASHGKPVLFGPHMQNFADIAQLFLEAEAALQVRDEEALEKAVRALLAEPERREELSRRAREVVSRNRGAADRTVAELKALLP